MISSSVQYKFAYRGDGARTVHRRQRVCRQPVRLHGPGAPSNAPAAVVGHRARQQGAEAVSLQLPREGHQDPQLTSTGLHLNQELQRRRQVRLRMMTLARHHHHRKRGAELLSSPSGIWQTTTAVALGKSNGRWQKACTPPPLLRREKTKKKKERFSTAMVTTTAVSPSSSSLDILFYY
ncbi:hypothetical protein MRX96_022161 [Rhipicephalus microplus]